VCLAISIEEKLMSSNNANRKDPAVEPDTPAEGWVNIATSPATDPQDFLAEEDEVIAALETPESDVATQPAADNK
jgi:hypothetical protein